MKFYYDVVVVGAGHAGCEAAVAAANLGASTCLITMDMNKIAQMSCNPAVGGIAKGQIVREIDALGGQMGIVTDRASIQSRMLNRSKGPAVWSPRAQCDREKFIWTWRSVLDHTENLHIWQDTVVELIYEPCVAQAETSADSLNNPDSEKKAEKSVEKLRVVGLRTLTDCEFQAKCVIITAGTFLNGLMHIGRTQIPGGRCAEPPSLRLTESIAKTGIRVGRMKTGTPVRIDKRSVDFSQMEEQPGDDSAVHFSYMGNTAEGTTRLKQLPCYITYTNPSVHEVLRSGFADSPLYNGQIQSIGPRYCPSIETKLHTFPDKQQHLLFLEPEGTDTNEMYLNGFSSSLPIDIQLKALRQIPAFSNLQVYRPGYAIEYDYFDPTQLTHSLESKVVANLFMAGQVNGTTGYEEAAGQGLIAGINAAIKARPQIGGGQPFTLARNEAYIGVLIDDLVTKGVDEPYRMFTSRAEYRILLRQDDADMRLTERSYHLGLASQERYDRMTQKRRQIESIIDFCENFSLKPALINEALAALNTTPLTQGIRLTDLLGRPQVTFDNIMPHIVPLQKAVEKICLGSIISTKEVLEAAEIRIKYSGYISREQQMAEKMLRLENIKIAGKFDYTKLSQISIEARQKLQAIQPVTLAQASRIPGVSPSDINIMLVLLGR